MSDTIPQSVPNGCRKYVKSRIIINIFNTFNDVKRLNDFIDKVGVDKVLHFAFGGWMVSAFSPLGIIGMVGALITLIILGVLKEKVLDDNADIMDIWASVAGAFVAFAVYVPIYIIIS